MGELVSGCSASRLPGKADVKFVNLAAGGKIEEVAGSDAVVVFGEGEASHPLKGKMEYLKSLNDRGASFGVFHYALMFGDGEGGAQNAAILDSLIGGHYQTHWSVNPYYYAKFEKFAASDAARGVRPFEIYDEWHFNMKFSEDPGQKITNLAVVVPPDKCGSAGSGRIPATSSCAKTSAGRRRFSGFAKTRTPRAASAAREGTRYGPSPIPTSGSSC